MGADDKGFVRERTFVNQMNRFPPGMHQLTQQRDKSFTIQCACAGAESPLPAQSYSRVWPKLPKSIHDRSLIALSSSSSSSMNRVGAKRRFIPIYDFRTVSFSLRGEFWIPPLFPQCGSIEISLIRALMMRLRSNLDLSRGHSYRSHSERSFELPIGQQRHNSARLQSEIQFGLTRIAPNSPSSFSSLLHRGHSTSPFHAERRTQRRKSVVTSCVHVNSFVNRRSMEYVRAAHNTRILAFARPMDHRHSNLFQFDMIERGAINSNRISHENSRCLVRPYSTELSIDE